MKSHIASLICKQLKVPEATDWHFYNFDKRRAVLAEFIEQVEASSNVRPETEPTHISGLKVDNVQDMTLEDSFGTDPTVFVDYRVRKGPGALTAYFWTDEDYKQNLQLTSRKAVSKMTSSKEAAPATSQQPQASSSRKLSILPYWDNRGGMDEERSDFKRASAIMMAVNPIGRGSLKSPAASNFKPRQATPRYNRIDNPETYSLLKPVPEPPMPLERPRPEITDFQGPVIRESATFKTLEPPEEAVKQVALDPTESSEPGAANLETRDTSAIDKKVESHSNLMDTETVLEPASPLPERVHKELSRRGLRNPHNHCYINSVLQCLLRLPEIENWYNSTIQQSRYSPSDSRTGQHARV